MTAKPHTLIATLLLCTAAVPNVFAAESAKGCIEMNGQTRCVESTPTPAPVWTQSLQRARKMNATCKQWLEIHKREPTVQNKAYRDMACNRSRENMSTLRPGQGAIERLSNSKLP